MSQGGITASDQPTGLIDQKKKDSTRNKIWKLKYHDWHLPPISGGIDEVFLV